jgi:hypothetical protein
LVSLPLLSALVPTLVVAASSPLLVAGASPDPSSSPLVGLVADADAVAFVASPENVAASPDPPSSPPQADTAKSNGNAANVRRYDMAVVYRFIAAQAST